MSLSVPRWSGSTSIARQVCPKLSERATNWLDLSFCMKAAYTVLPSAASTTIWGSSWRVVEGQSARGSSQVAPPSFETCSLVCGLGHVGQLGFGSPPDVEVKPT